MSVFYDLNKTPRNILNQAIVRAIVSENNGAWLDPSNMTTLYQDAAGTTPVTAVEQPVGLILDKSQGLELGLERVVNGDNEAGISAPPLNTLTNFTSKVQSSERAQSGNYSVKLTSNSTSAPHYWNLVSVSAGVSLKISGWVYIPAGTTANQPIKLVDIFDGSYTPVIASSFDQWVYFSAIRPAKATAWALAIGNNDVANWNGGSIYIDNLSVREIKGNHATQSITASRPTLSARYNLLTKTEDFSAVSWNKEFSGTGAIPLITPNYALAPDGSMTASRIVYALNGGTTLNDYSRVSQAVSLPANTQTVLGVWLKSASSQTKNIVISMTGEYPKVVSVGTDWAFITNAMIRADTNYSLRIELRGAFGSSDSADILIWHPDLRLGASAGPYQRVNTATDYDTDPRYFPKYLRFDGVDDYLNLPYMRLYAGGEMSIITARDAVSQSTDTYIISERSTTDADPKYFPSRQLASGGNMDAYISDDAEAVVLDTTGSAFGGATDKVIRSVVDTGSNIKLYKNGVLAADDNYTRSGTLTLNNTTIGASVSTTTSNYASMKMYGLIVTKSALTDAQRVRCERFLARKAEVTL